MEYEIGTCVVVRDAIGIVVGRVWGSDGLTYQVTIDGVTDFYHSLEVRPL